MKGLLASVLTELLRQGLTEAEERISRWRTTRKRRRYLEVMERLRQERLAWERDYEHYKRTGRWP